MSELTKEYLESLRDKGCYVDDDGNVISWYDDTPDVKDLVISLALRALAQPAQEQQVRQAAMVDAAWVDELKKRLRLGVAFANEEMLDCIERLERAAALPAGVAVEPTEEMMEAGDKAIMDGLTKAQIGAPYGLHPEHASWNVYKAMIGSVK